MLKSDLRVKHLNKRNELSVEERDRFSTLIFNRLIKVAQVYQRIGVYISMNHEVDTRQFIQWCFSQNKQVYVPKIVEKRMIFIEIHSLDECIHNKMGILEPTSNQETEDKIELMIVPMLAFNQKNYRLGYGKGYYDQYLSKHNVITLGICFRCNLDNELIEEEHDVKLAQIFTELE
jgi:5-formyltetrahydrofolate cyclo-ligase